MTNELPVVGKRYNFYLKQYQKNQPIFIKIEAELINFEELPEDEAETKPETQNYDSESIKKDQINKAMQSINDLRVYREGYNKGWNECLEEVKKQMPNHISELSPEVKEAMEELKKESLHIPFGDLKDYHYNKLKQDAKNLLNALDKQFSKTPNEETLKSFSDYENKDGLTKYDSVEELFEDLEGKNS